MKVLYFFHSFILGERTLNFGGPGQKNYEIRLCDISSENIKLYYMYLNTLTHPMIDENMRWILENPIFNLIVFSSGFADLSL